MARTLTQRELNRAVLARQLLLERAATPLAKALERVGGIQAQYAPSMYVGLWSRLRDFERDALTRALVRRSVVQATLMRTTIHLVSRADYWPLALAVRDARRSSWLRAAKPDPAEIERAAERLRATFAGGALPRRELEAAAGKRHAIGVGLWLDMVRVPPAGTWERRRADLFGLAEDWLGPPAVTPDDALELLVRRYLSGFGPATRPEIASWAGLRVGDLAPALERIELRRFAAEDGAELLDLPRAPLPAAGTPAPVRFLPTWDATLLVHARRAMIVREEHRPLIFHTKLPQSIGTFLVDGTVAGTWRREPGGVTWEAFAPLDASDREAVAAEAERLSAFMA